MALVSSMSIKNKLNRLKPHLSHETAGKTESHKVLPETKKDIPYLNKWEEEGVFPYYFDHSYCLIREKEYPIDYKHGIYTFAQFSEAVKKWNQSDVPHPLSASGHSAESFFFFDTETTGLGGGAGNSIFILGHASLCGDKIKLKQHILPHPGAEVPLYQSFLESADYTTMATYNGKSFDWPQVKTQHTLIKEHVPKLPPYGHFDLYHAARRMWKHKLDRIKLSVVEKEVLGFERKDDLPGHLAPMIYFDFVERKDPEGMLGILKHNEMDILSLISLYTHLSFQILGLDDRQTSREFYEVGRWFSHIGESEHAEKMFTRISGGDADVAHQAKHALAFQYKKEKRWEEAAGLWEDVAEFGQNPKLQLEACIELSKIFEHRTISLEKALQYAIRAENFSKSDEEIEKRINRLERKLNAASTQ